MPGRGDKSVQTRQRQQTTPSSPTTVSAELVTAGGTHLHRTLQTSWLGTAQSWWLMSSILYCSGGPGCTKPLWPLGFTSCWTCRSWWLAGGTAATLDRQLGFTASLGAGRTDFTAYFWHTLTWAGVCGAGKCYSGCSTTCTGGSVADPWDCTHALQQLLPAGLSRASRCTIRGQVPYG